MRIAATVLASVTVLSLNILPVQARCSVQSFNFPFGQPGASDLTDILDQRDRDYCIAELLSR